MNDRHLTAVPDDIDQNALVLAMVELIGEMHWAERILDGSLIMDHATETLIATETGNLDAVADIDRGRREAIRANWSEVNGPTEPSLLLAALVGTSHVGFGAKFNGWYCSCKDWSVILSAPELGGKTCSHIATVSTLARHDNPPPQLADLPAGLLEQIRDHHREHGF